MTGKILATPISATEAIAKHNMYFADMLQYIRDTSDYGPVLDADGYTVKDSSTGKVLGHVVEYTCPSCERKDAWLVLIGWEDQEVCCSWCSHEFDASDLRLDI